MQILISLLIKTNEINNINKFFTVYDTDTKNITHLTFKNQNNGENLTRGTGMCYYDNFWYAACIAKEHRIASRLLIVNYKTGEHTINKLNFTKAIHGICAYGKQGPNTVILANSPQNDTVSIITTYGTKVLTEDLFFDFLTPEERVKLNWNEEYEHDDSFHNNSIVKYKKNIYASMFLDYKYMGSHKINNPNWRTDKHFNEPVGAIYNLTNLKPVKEKLKMPHTIFFNSKGDLIICESSPFKLINTNTNKEAQLKGFTRGLCEDKQKGGYWIGLSFHRKLSTEVTGAMVQFVSYDMKAEDSIDLSHLGKEIFDIIEFKQGRYSK